MPHPPRSRSVKIFYALKQFVWNLLNKHTVFMKQHTLGLDKVDVCSPGWFSYTNPTYHSKQRIKDDIYLHSTRALGDFSDEIKQDLADNFSEYITKDNTFEIPEFHLVHRNIVEKGSQGKFETETLEVQLEQKHSKVFKHIMELSFEKTASTPKCFSFPSLSSANSQVMHTAPFFNNITTTSKTTATSPSLALAISV
jgi:hypothetical protein